MAARSKSGLALVLVAGSPLKILWSAGTFGSYDAKFKKKFNRRKYVNFSLIDSCKLTGCKCCDGSINIYIASGLLLGLARLHHRRWSWLRQDVKDLKDAHEETRRASSRSIDVPRSRPGEVDLPSLDYSACSSLLQLNQSSVDMFKNAYLKEGDYLTFRVNPLMASAGRQEDSLYVEVDDSYTADPRDITLPDISTDKSRDIFGQMPDLDDSFGDGGMAFFDADAKFPDIAIVTRASGSIHPKPKSKDQTMDNVSNSFQYLGGGESDQSENSIVPYDRQKGASEDPLPPGGVSQFSLECIFTAPSIPVNRRRKVPFKKQVFDKDIRLREYDPNPELITDAYKIRPGPRAGMPAPKFDKELFSINNMMFHDKQFCKLLRGWDSDAAMSNPPPPTDISPTSPLSQSELEKTRIVSKDNLTQKSDQASRSRLTSSLKNSVSLHPGKSRVVAGGKTTRNPGGLSPIADVEAEEYTYSQTAYSGVHSPAPSDSMEADVGGMMDDNDNTPEQPFTEDLPELATTPQPLNRSTIDHFTDAMVERLIDSRSLLFTEIAPPGVMDKRTAASKFFKLLSAASQPINKLKLEQEESYGPVKISNKT